MSVQEDTALQSPLHREVYGIPAEKGPRRYRPLDVSSYTEGFRVIVGWLLVPWLAVVTGLLLWQYEATVINITDRDLRDMYYDARVTGRANNFYHKYFMNAEICCNPDPLIIRESSMGCYPRENYTRVWIANYQKSTLLCPPTIVLQCPGSFQTTACKQAHASLLIAAGMDPNTGNYRDCMRAGRVLVGAELVGATRPFVLRVSVAATGELPGRNLAVVEQFTIADPLRIDQTVITSFVDGVASNYSDSNYFSPNKRLSKSLAINGAPVPLTMSVPGSDLRPIPGANGLRRINPWPTEIFNWPGLGKRCPSSDTFEQWWLRGELELRIPAFDYNDPQSMISTLTFFNEEVQFSPWRVTRAADADLNVNSPDDTVRVEKLTKIAVYVGLVAVNGGCDAWMLDVSDGYPKYTYTEVAVGKLSELSLGAFDEVMMVEMYDVGAPQYIALPFYTGMWFIVFCFGMAAIWLFGLSVFILTVPCLIYWNVRDNNGLPPVVYRYMKAFRGW